MLRFLDNNLNRKNSPNENYARELLELFSIGKGPQIGPGNYTNYTEIDILCLFYFVPRSRNSTYGFTISAVFS